MTGEIFLNPVIHLPVFAIGLVSGALALFFFWRKKAKAETTQLQNKFRDHAVELRETRGELARQGEIAAQITSLVQMLTENHPRNALPNIVVRFLGEFFHASAAGFFAPAEDTGDFTLVAGFGFPKEWLHQVRLPRDEDLLGLALQKKTVITREDLVRLGGPRAGSLSFEKAGIQPDFVAPVFGLTSIVGVVVGAGCAGKIDEEKKFLSAIVDLASIAFQYAALHETSNTNFSYDHLTGVANRNFFAQRFESMIRHARNYMHPLSLLFFDIDHFKGINDTHGHQAGDAALKKVAQITRGCTRSSDIVARYGGDEFVVLIANSCKEEAATYAEHLRAEISAMEVRVPGQNTPIQVNISVGVSTFPEDGVTTEELARAADIALYIAKKNGRNQVVLATQAWLKSGVAEPVV